MNKFEKALNEINTIDKFSLKNSIIHKLNPVTKLIVTIAYIVMVTSCYKYNIISLLPWFTYPTVMVILSDIPIIKTIKKLVVILPIILFIGMGNIIFNQKSVVVYGITTTYGTISFVSFALKSLLSLWAMYIFICTTGIYNLAYGLLRIKVPEVFVWILVLLYRYIFVIIEQLNTVVKAYTLTAPKEKGIHFKAWGSLLGNLFYRTIERGQELYSSMYLRGFGENKSLCANKNFKLWDFVYIFICFVVFILFKGSVN